jgi:hypothetical protein
MTTFCTDIDLLHWEPNLLRDASFASQTLLSGTADLSGTSVTISGSPFTFEDTKIQPNHLIHLGNPLDGSYPIVAVDSATQITISVLYDGLFPDEGESVEAAPVGTASAISYAIRTFFAQRQIVSELLLQAAGLEADQSSAILNPTDLRRPCALGALQMIFSALAAVAEDPADFSTRADLYERLYRRALRSTVVEVDLDQDGIPESRRALNVMELRRT